MAEQALGFPADVEQLVARARGQGLADMLHRTAARLPDKPALIDGETTLTFAELEAAVDRVAAALDRRGIERGERVALLSRNCWEYVVLVYATARLGVVLVPVNFMLGAEEVAFILEHSQAAALVCQQGLLDTGTAALRQGGASVRLRALLHPHGPLDGWEDVRDWLVEQGTPPERVVGDDEPIRLMYTSGTESRPKGALLTSRALMWQYASCAIGAGFTEDDVELHALPLYHCAQLDVFLGPDLWLGCTSVLLSAPDPATMLRLVAEHRVTKLFCPPTVWIGLLRSPDFDATDLSSLRKGYYGASPMPVEVLKELQSRLPEVRLWNLYGQTEIAPLATLLPPEEQLSHAGSAGRAALNVETRVVDDDDNPVEPGEVGEIVHRSPHLTLGYYRDPDKTAEAFRNGWFHSGDLGVADRDGRISVVDRKKDMIKTGGENVASREVEECVYTLEGVAEVAVFATDHPTWVEAVTAAVVPKPGATVTGDAVVAHCRARLAGFKVPKRVVVVEALPKNPSGKILKRALREQYGG